MASSWGSSWLSAWDNSWGAVSGQQQAIVAGKPSRRRYEPPRKRRWAVWTEYGYRHFDTADEAYAFLFPEEQPRRKTERIQRVRLLGPAPQPRVTYAEQDIAEVTVKGMPGIEAFSLGDRILARAIQKRVEKELRDRAAAEEGERLRKAAAAAARAERKRREELAARLRQQEEDELVAMLLLAA